MTCLNFQCRHRYDSGFTLDAQFNIGEGVTALFGPSGSGKSTILNILTGILKPAEAHITLRDRVLVDTSQRICLAPERRCIGMVFQDHLLFPHMTVAANLRYGHKRHSARDIDMDRLVELLELGGLLDRSPQTLSGGQRQRVALGRAILSGPELLLMDEPLSALDESLKDRILTYLERSIEEWRIPTLFVSHDQTDVRRLAEQVVVLEAGRVIDAGPTAQRLDRAVIEGMTSHPGPVNLLRLSDLRKAGDLWEGRLGEQWVHLPGDSPAMTGGGAALVQLQPREVILSRAGDVKGLSVRNQLHGTVREVIAVDGRVFVAIDVGQFLWAEVTAAAAQELTLQAGATVTCLIKASAVRVVG